MSDEMIPAPAAGGAMPEPQRLPVRFVGSGSEFFRIWIVNLLLTLVTLGLYYPFAKARRLRYFHAATEVGGQPLAFHADPWKMFRGYVLVALMLAAYSGAGQFSALAGGIAFLIVAALWPALWHSSLRFRLANTSWRGLRFRYTGTRRQAYQVMAAPILLFVAFALLAWWATPAAPAQPPSTPPAPPDALAVVVAFLPLLLMLLGLPALLWLLKRQQHGHYALGAEHTAFSVGLGRFYGFWLRSAGVALLVALGFAALIVGGGLLLGLGGGAAMAAPMLMVVGVMLVYLVAFALIGGHFTARLQNLVWNGTASAQLRFESRLRARDLARLWFGNTLLMIVTLGLYFPFAQVASARLRLSAVSVLSTIDPEQLMATASAVDESAAGDAAGDLFGFDIGL
jgi:uncharacterized membrane protein YjgN (DUF898 family)